MYIHFRTRIVWMHSGEGFRALRYELSKKFVVLAKIQKMEWNKNT